LVAMKLQSVMNRGRDKEAIDLLDIIQLSFDRNTGPAAAQHADMWFRARVAAVTSARWSTIPIVWNTMSSRAAGDRLDHRMRDLVDSRLVSRVAIISSDPCLEVAIATPGAYRLRGGADSDGECD